MIDRMGYGQTRREQNHRRVLLLALGVLLVLATSPLFGHHLLFGLDRVLVGRDHIWVVCLIALHGLLGPVHSGFHVLFLSGLAYAIWDRVRAFRSLRRVLASVAARPPRPGESIWSAAKDSSVDPQRILVVPGLPTPAFTAGWLRPRIFLAAELDQRLSADEIAAVLAHESAHLARRDPLRLSVLRFLGCTLFWIPALARLAADVADEREVRADDRAAQKHGLALASALVRLATWGRPSSPTPGVGFIDGDLLERRVRRLTGEEVSPRSRLTPRSLMAAGFALALAWSSGIAVTHPMPLDDDHCEHHTRAAIFHLFCRSGLHGSRDDCPHGHHPS